MCKYLVEDKDVAGHSSGEIMVNCHSMASFNFVEERHLERVALSAVLRGVWDAQSP